MGAFAKVCLVTEAGCLDSGVWEPPTLDKFSASETNQVPRSLLGAKLTDDVPMPSCPSQIQLRTSANG